MTSTLEELTTDVLSREYVERRVADWKQRLDELYENIVSWLAPEWQVAPQRRHVRMLEEPMREIGLDAEILPNLDLFKGGSWSLAFSPRALWIIGANGRVDVTRPDQMITTHFLIDASEHFQPAQWKIVSLDDRGTRTPLDRSSLRAVV